MEAVVAGYRRLFRKVPVSPWMSIIDGERPANDVTADILTRIESIRDEYPRGRK